MPELHLALWSIPELLAAIFAASVVLTNLMQPLAQRKERSASLAFRWIMSAVALLMFSMFLQHSGLVDPAQAMWWTYMLATTTTPLGIRLARGKTPHPLEWAFIGVSLLFAGMLLVYPRWFIEGYWHNPLGFSQTLVGPGSTVLVMVQTVAVALSASRLYYLRRFGPMEGASILTLMWSFFALTAIADQLAMSFQLAWPPVLWLGAVGLTATFTRVVSLHHQRMAQILQKASRERAAILERIVQDQPIQELMAQIEQLPLIGREENQRLAQTAQEHHRLLRDLEFRASHDPLTGLANRPYLAQGLEAIHAPGQQVALLVIDLNGFKRINDTLGHATGDSLLIEVAKRLRSALPPEAMLARFGGDEFVALLPQACPNAVGDLAEGMGQSFKQPFHLMGLDMFVSASIGIGFAEANRPDLVVLHSQADMAMYYAKEQGRPWMVYQHSMSHEFQQRLTLENALREALEDYKQFALVYQPVVALDSSQLVAFEALLRWNSPSLGPVSPVSFIAVAEESGLIVPLGKWVLRTACQQAVQWQALSKTPISLGVNVSAYQFEHPEFVQTVEAALEETGLPPECLVLEVVESVLMLRFEEVAERLQALQALGVRISLDDFGTGFSSLNYLHQLPFDSLKIDRSFVQPLGRSPKAYALVDSIVHLAHALGKRVVVEGIETPAQRALMQNLQADLAQGYLFAKPLPVEHLPDFILENQREFPGLELPHLLEKKQNPAV